jgi:hypothetical protein
MVFELKPDYVLMYFSTETVTVCDCQFDITIKHKKLEQQAVD